MAIFAKLSDLLNIGNHMPKLDNITPPSVPDASVQDFKFDEKDLESEHSLWCLYEKWSSHFKVSRSLEEKHTRFSTFKDNVLYIHNFNNTKDSYWLKLNKSSDISHEELMNARACKIECGRPAGMFSRKELRAKWDAWKGVEGKSEEEAMGDDYITKMKQLLEEGGVAA